MTTPPRHHPSPAHPKPLPAYLPDPSRARFRAAQKVAVAPSQTWERIPALTAGELLWREDDDRVILTPDGWLVYANGFDAMIYTKRMRATAELAAAIRGRER